MLSLVALLVFLSVSFGKVFVVERETGKLAVIDKDKVKKEIENLGNLNHATLKFFKGYAYLISRDGYLSKIDPERGILLKKVKVGSSTIGINFCNKKILIANYAPKNVVLVDENLDVLREINTESRNVGIKSNGEVFIYALMDKDKVEIRDCDKGTLIKEFNVGKMPFDALLYKDKYIVGFFRESGVGIIDLKSLTYKKVIFKRKGKGEVVFKIPHFGFWGIKGKIAYIPAVGERKIHVVDIENMSYLKSIEVKGLPVFVQVSPDGRYLAVNYSGDSEDFLTIVDLKSEMVLNTKPLGKRILHYRFTPDGKFIYLSSYFENKVKKVSVPDLKVLKEFKVPTPSGVFIYGGK
ncbi:MAG TPA: NirF protein [Aquifex aeolicus]|nr:NirF protein [Aquifex aeolicus]